MDILTTNSPVSTNRFIKANTEVASLSEIENKHIIPVFAKDNHLTISLDVDVRELFLSQVLPVYINEEIKSHGFIYYLHACDVNLRPSNTRQCVLLHGNGGIARCNTLGSDIYNVGIRANVYANVRLTLEN